MLARRKMSSGELAEKVGISATNLSILKTGKAKAVRFSTLEALCRASTANPATSWNMFRTTVYNISSIKTPVFLNKLAAWLLAKWQCINELY